MKRLTLEQWDAKYIKGSVERFDQKYTMFSRAGWDPKVHGAVENWAIDAETCRMYWGRKNQGCTVCMAYCPYNKPDTRFHRMVRWLTDHVRWGDPAYVWLDKLLGYGKPKPADHFWEDWDPQKRW